jgi:hypothetical protein
VVAIHGVLGADQRLEGENPAIAEGQLQLDAVLQNTLKIADTPDLTEAIKPVR